MSRKNIAIFHYATPPIVGGVESTIYHHARLLIQSGYDVSIITGRGEAFHPSMSFHLIPEIDSRHPRVLEVGELLSQGKISSQFESLRDLLITRLSAILSHADATIAHNVLTLHKNLPLTAALYRLSDEGVTRLIAWCHDFAWQDALYTSDLHPGYPWDLLRTPWPGVRYVVVSEHRRLQLATLLDIPESEISVVTPGVDVGNFLKLEPLTQRLIEKLDLLNADPLLLLPARITRRKNIQFAIRVTAALKRHKPRATLVITGPPGPHNVKNIAYLDSLKSLREELGVTDQVHFLYEQGQEGQPLHVPDEVVADLFHLADLLFFPSRREGFGIPVLEAGLARLPVFAADIPPVHESAANLAELFDLNDDPKGLAEIIANRLADNRAYKLKRRVLERFTWQKIVESKLIPIIESQPFSENQ
jgi:glycosyltransferase involved in cell wall biosynthesis